MAHYYEFPIANVPLMGDLYLFKYTITFGSNVVGHVNPSLAQVNNMSDENLKKLINLHCNLYAVYEAMKMTNNREELRKLATHVERIEFQQQKVWGFKQSKKHHQWFDVPKCSCSKSDNKHHYGITTKRIINSTCIVHGD